MKEDPKIKKLIESEWIAMFNEQHDELRKQAKENILKIQEENKHTFNHKRKRANKYREDDLVAIRKTQVTPGSKLAAKYYGPYQIIKTLRNDQYILKKVGEHNGLQETSTSADYIKPWINNISDYSTKDLVEDDEIASEDRCLVQDGRV